MVERTSSLFVALFVLANASTTFADPPRFAHAVHKDVKKAPTCNDCHKLSAATGWAQKTPVIKGREPHQPCSMSGCHQDRYIHFSASKDLNFCLQCHIARPEGKLRYPPYRSRGESDFWLAGFDHADHMREGNRGCPLCHDLDKAPAKGASKEMRRVGHDTCGNTICHGERVEPKMAGCGCHVAKDKTQVELSASSEWTQFRVKKLFSHRAHAKASKSNECGQCHTNVAVKKGERVLLPPMIACESCHNGKQAFDALGATCTKCHGEGKPDAKKK
jgi:c(7)-type cytochrome triheme protein